MKNFIFADSWRLIVVNFVKIIHRAEHHIIKGTISYIVYVRNKEDANKSIILLKNTLRLRDYNVELCTVCDKNIVNAYDIGTKNAKGIIKVYFSAKDIAFIKKDFSIELVRLFGDKNNAGIIGVLGLRRYDYYGKVKQYWGRYEWQENNNIINRLNAVNPLAIKDVDVINPCLFATNVDCISGKGANLESFIGDVCSWLRENNYNVKVMRQDERKIVFSKPIFINGNDAFVYYPLKRLLNYPLVSVLIPTYNNSYYCEIALRSVLQQTYKKIEIIIGDDSTDNETEEMVKKYLMKYKNISYYHHSHPLGKLGDNNLDFLLKKSRGKYISVLFHDDFMYPERLNEMMAVYQTARNVDVSLVASARDFVNDSGEILKSESDWKPSMTCCIPMRELGRDILFNCLNCIGELSNVLFSRKALFSDRLLKCTYGYFCNIREYSMGDISTFLDLSKKGGKIVILNQALSSFRIHDGSNSNNKIVIVRCIIDWLGFIILGWLNNYYIDNFDEFVFATRKWYKKFNVENVIKMMEFDDNSSGDYKRICSLLFLIFSYVEAGDYKKVIKKYIEYWESDEDNIDECRRLMSMVESKTYI